MNPLRSLARFAPLVLLLLFAACDSGDPSEPRIGISGSWSGTLTNTVDETQMYPVRLTLSDNGSRVTGSGSVTIEGEALDFAVVTGLFAAPSLSLELRYDRPPQGTLSGNVTPAVDRIDGTMSGPGLANGEVELMLSLQRMPDESL